MREEIVTDLEKKARLIRKKVLELGYRTKAGHLSSALSCIDIMVALYYAGYVCPKDKEINRNRFLLSKGHACIAQYTILADLGVINPFELDLLCKPRGILGAHPDCLKVPGIDASTGALGHGLSIGVGMALAFKYLELPNKVYVILGDGECQEGSVWEAAICASQNKLSNLIVIVDYNKLQASDFVSNIGGLEPFAKKWESFGFDTFEIDGNDMLQVIEALKTPCEKFPRAIIANTIKGKGVEIIENDKNWHGRQPNDDEWRVIGSQWGE